MPDLWDSDREYQRSHDQEADALNYLGTLHDAGNALVKAIDTGQNTRTAAALFAAAAVPALVHAVLAAAAASRAQAAAIDDYQRSRP